MRSGYPSANGLRLLMCSDRHRNDAMSIALHGEKGGGIDGKHLAAARGKNAVALELFRNGGFGSVDEFCRLAGRRDNNNTLEDLEKVMRFALCLHNPEDHFEESEYYPFIQRLFKNDSCELREDIALLTYNYDPYLDFLLRRARVRRRRVRGGDRPLAGEEEALNALSSGFFSPGKRQWVQRDGFCLLKLHGSIIFPCGYQMGQGYPVLTEKDLFELPARERFEKLSELSIRDSPVPAVFPWEIMDEKGEFIPKKESFFHEGAGWGGIDMYSLFQEIWSRARKEVQAANKISFVGLSIHYYLKGGLAFLLKGKTNPVEIIVANDRNEPIMRSNNNYRDFPQSPACRVGQIMTDCTQGLDWGGKPNRYKGPKTNPKELTLYSSFAEFIEEEMDQQ